ncbi:MAG: HEAT repeat domain-containing protein [Gemmataceae bacterium]
MFRFCLVCAMGLALVAPLPAADEPTSASIARLIQQLGADTFAEREAASQALDRLGAPALEALQKASRHSDAEVRKRAIDLVGRIEKRVETSRVLAPTLVHLVYRDTPLDEALADLRKKSGYNLVMRDPEGKLKVKKITLDTGKVSFWTALEKFCLAAGLEEETGPAGGVAAPGAPSVAPPVRIRAVPVPAPAPVPVPPPAPPAPGKRGARNAGPAPARAVAVAALQPALVPPPPVADANATPTPVPGQIVLQPGKFPSGADTSSSIRVRAADRKRYPAPPTDKEYGVVLQLSLEPRLSMHLVTGVQIDRAVDDSDQKLIQAIEDPSSGTSGRVIIAGGGRMVMIGGGRVGGTYYASAPNGLHHHHLVRLTKGDRESSRLKQLEGTISAQILLERQEILSIDAPAKAQGKTFKGKTGGEIEITSVTRQDDGTIQIEFDYTPAEGMYPETRYARPRAVPGVNAAVPPMPAAGPAGAMPAIAVLPGTLATFYTPWGLTLVDDKGELLQAAIHPNYRKGRGGVVAPGALTGKNAFVATYRPAKGAPAEPARLVYTARKMVPVSIPFKLRDVDLK